jgi:hypothetical protein
MLGKHMSGRRNNTANFCILQREHKYLLANQSGGAKDQYRGHLRILQFFIYVKTVRLYLLLCERRLSSIANLLSRNGQSICN